MFKRILRNETGQMAVFIALIFQVLFVLFAMVINIGLIVHDKINLQNSVDLAAYYAASKQAEAMNMIAHINYQMRQDYKLLTWRYRVLGSFGADQPLHPGLTKSETIPDVEYSIGGKDPSSVCVGHQGWLQSFQQDPVGNRCKTSTMTIPDLTPIAYVPFSLPMNLSVVQQFKDAREIIRQGCQFISPLNWSLATLMISGYRLSITERKKQIQKLASEISKDADFLDVRGDRVRDGALKTFQKNLTSSNYLGSDESKFEIINGLAQGDCGQLNTLGFPKWLVDIPIAPIVRYTELTVQSAGSAQCNATTKSYDQPPSAQTISVIDPSGELRGLAHEPETSDIHHSSRGFEKNPWCLAYIAIKAKTKPRKPFAPFGSAIEMEAKAIAEPFGGRIGPWYGKTWPAQATQSDSADTTDPLAVPRGDFDPKYKQLFLPNYSRFPGDTLGLRSKLALSLMRTQLYDAFNSVDTNLKLDLADYGGVVHDFQTSGDVLSWSSAVSDAGKERRMEIAAVAPDLFDMAYYSIDPDYYRDYFLQAKDKLFQGIIPVSDVGSRADKFPSNNVKNDWEASKNFPDTLNAYYLAKKWEHLLTSWTQGGAVDYSIQSPEMIKRFGACDQPVEATKPATPGSCVVGGRVGYSVRLVHKDYLSTEAERGGSGAGKDKIRNPLPSTFFE